jgi:hypothetical protein
MIPIERLKFNMHRNMHRINNAQHSIIQAMNDFFVRSINTIAREIKKCQIQVLIFIITKLHKRDFTTRVDSLDSSGERDGLTDMVRSEVRDENLRHERKEEGVKGVYFCCLIRSIVSIILFL